MYLKVPIKITDEGKKWTKFEKFHIIHDLISFIITLTMSILGSCFIKADIDSVFFVIVITEMQLLGLVLKVTFLKNGMNSLTKLTSENLKN